MVRGELLEEQKVQVSRGHLFNLSLFSSRFTVLVHDLGQLRVRACHRMWAVRLQVMPADSAGFPGVVLGLPTTIGPKRLQHRVTDAGQRFD